MRALIACVLLALVSLAAARSPVSRVYVGYDDSVNTVVLSNAMRLFGSGRHIPFTTATSFRIDDPEAVVNALGEADVIYLCPSFTPYVLDDVGVFLLNDFVENGGVVIYPAGFGDVRARDVATWLENPLLQVQSSQFANNVGELYYGNRKLRGYQRRDPYENYYVALPTDQSLFTSFARIDDNNKWGLPVQWFSNNLYWVQDNMHQMLLDDDNREFCMFERRGNYTYRLEYWDEFEQRFYGYTVPGDLDEACWVFNFPVGSGFVVEIGNSFATSDVFNEDFVDRFVGAVAAAVGQHREAAENFVEKDSNVLLKRDAFYYFPEYWPEGPEEYNPNEEYWPTEEYWPEDRQEEYWPEEYWPTGPELVGSGAFQNVAYDLSLVRNVFVWKNTYNLNELRRLRRLTNADEFVLLDIEGRSLVVDGRVDLDLNELTTRRIDENFSDYYREMIENGDNLVVLYDARGTADFLNDNFFFGDMSRGSRVSRSAEPTEGAFGGAFGDIESLPRRSDTNTLSGRNSSCVFYVPGYDCAVWTEQVGGNDGHFTFLSWNFAKNYLYDTLDYSERNRRESSWPELSWRAALHAGLKPDSPDPVEFVDLFDYETMSVRVPLKVALLADRNYADSYQAMVNVYRFLDFADHLIYLLTDASDGDYVNTFLSGMDGLVLANGRVRYNNDIDIDIDIDRRREVPGFPVFVELPDDVQAAIRTFSYDGGRVVATGKYSSDMINQIFGQNLVQNELHRFQQRRNSVDYAYFDDNDVRNPGYIFDYGLDMVSHLTDDTRFTRYYQRYNTIPGLFPSDAVEPYLFTDVENGLNYCAYHFAMDSQYCAVFNRRYGPNGGYFSVLANSFLDGGNGFRSTYIHNEPWSRVLNIALGGDPNDPPSATPSPTRTLILGTPTVTVIPTPSPSFSPTYSPSVTESISLGVEVPPTPRRSRSATMTNSPVSPSPTRSQLATALASATPSVSITPSPVVDEPNMPGVSASPMPSEQEVFLPEPPTNELPKSSSSPSPLTRPSFQPDPEDPGRMRPLVPFSGSECRECRFGEVSFIMEEPGNGGTGTMEIQLITFTGINLGSVFVPESYGFGGTFLDLTFATNLPIDPRTRDLGSVIVDITMRDAFGRPIRRLPEPLKICLREPRPFEKDEGCLSFFNEDTGDWECEDVCLEKEDSKYCGETDHLTSFALLLNGIGHGGGSDNNDPCDSRSIDYVFTWLTIAFVAAAICFILIGIVLIEIRFRKAAYQRTSKFNKMSKTVSKEMRR